MDLIFSSIGTPSADDVEFISNEKAYQYIRRLKRKPRVPWQQKFPNASDDACDLLDKMLQFNPNTRFVTPHHTTGTL